MTQVYHAPTEPAFGLLQESARKLAPVCTDLGQDTPKSGQPDPRWWERQSALTEAGCVLGLIAALPTSPVPTNGGASDVREYRTTASEDGGSDALGETVAKLREDLVSLNIREGEEWYALIGKNGYDLCLESARFQPDHPNAHQDGIVGRFACGAYAIRCLSVVARAMNALPTLLTALEQRGDGWLPIESAPKDGTPLLLWVDGHTIEGSFDQVACEWVAGQWGLGFGDDPTHWMPLPTPTLPED